tara:strand:- start:807 stop:989 length:183 start_codon:yes stop_codon:yes gene_type:complete
MDNNKQIQGSEMFYYFINHFGMTQDEALFEMETHGQDIKSIKRMLINKEREDNEKANKNT